MNSRAVTKKQLDEWLEGKLELDRYAASVLGERGWSLLQRYGRLMGGPHSGQYVSSLEMARATKLVESLERGDEQKVHLMHPLNPLQLDLRYADFCDASISANSESAGRSPTYLRMR
jgi:hypothetical protein